MPDRTQNPMRCVPDWRVTLPLAQHSPRCGARTRDGTPCQGPAMRGRSKCRMHGGGSCGPSPEGIGRIRVARTVHGGRGAEGRELRKMIAELKAATKRLIELV